MSIGPSGLLLVVAVGMSAAVFHPIVGVQFHLDDYLHLYEIVNLSPGRFLLMMHAGHLYLARNAVFLALHALFGTDPAPYMWCAYLTHLLNVALLYAVLRRLTGRASVACFGAVLWGTAPVNAGALGWYSVYGQVLAATCVLAVLLLLARVATGAPSRRATPWLCAVLMLVGSTCFGVGLAIALVMPVVAWLLLSASSERRAILGALAAVAVLVVPLYLIVQSINVSELGGLAAADYMTVNARGLGRMGRFFGSVVGVGVAALQSGPYFRSSSHPGLLAWVAVLAFVVALGLALWRAPARQRRYLAAGLLLALTPYAMIAAGRSNLPNDPNLARLVSSARYHYAAPLGLAMVSALIVAVAGQTLPLSVRARTALLVGWLIAVGAAHVVAGPRIEQFAAERRAIERILAEQRDAIAAAAPGQDVYLENRPHFLSAVLASRYPGSAAVFAVHHPDVVDGHRVRFIVRDEAQRAAWRFGRRGGALIVGPDDVPPAPGG